MAKDSSPQDRQAQGPDPAEKLLGRAFLTSTDPLARILDLADDAIISVDDEQRIILFNQGAERVFGYAAHEVMGQSLNVLLPSRLHHIHGQHVHDFKSSPVSARRMGERSEILGKRKSGQEFPAEASISKIGVDGQNMYTVILRDVTQRMAAEEKIKQSLRDKEALLKEIHHRVKNNLQVVSSLLGLQSRVLTDETTRKMFQESQNRIHSMALLHESLYQSNNLSRIDFPDYIRQLASHLFHSYGVAAERIHLRTDLEKLYLNLDAAVPCGLIINELVSNSLKYAFPDGRTGEVRIELHEHPDGLARLVVADNGIGLRSDIDWETARTLGLRLVRTLAEQLGATIEVKSTAGTEVQLTFAAAA
ncbi:MAG TPA: histidine kinase dimerization/phosphoacceptor domain -containing protein [Bryobacteraceae bacterium]|nr:histidine kinase dimerization/phosphoacceptor domain -containing protein [Bryobacteraceae bacterium]